MNQKTSSRMTLLALGLAILLGAWGCKNADKKGEATPGSGAAGTAASGTPGQAAAPGATPAPVAESTPITPDKMPDVVAKVNGQAIKKDDLVKGAQVVRMKMAQMGQPVALTGTFYHQVLDELIGITLLQQQAKAAGIAPSEAEVNQQVAARKSSFPSEEVYKQALQQTGLTEDLLRKQTRDQMAVQKYVETKVVANIAVTDQAAKDFYEKNKAEIHTPERLHLRHILLRVDPKTATPADKQKAKAKADDLLKQIQGGADFAKLATASSEDPGSKVQGGDLGWMVLGQQTVPPSFEKAAAALTKPNEISPVVESPFGYHIIQLVERAAPTAVPYDQVKDRIAGMLKQKQAQEMVQNRIKELRSKAKVEVFL